MVVSQATVKVRPLVAVKVSVKMPNRPLHKMNIHKPNVVGTGNPLMIFSSFISTFATTKLIALVREALELVVERTDNEIDDEALDLVFAILEGKASEIVKEARELSEEIAGEAAEAVTEAALERFAKDQ